MTRQPCSKWVRTLSRFAFVVAAGAALAGCVVAPYPARPHYYWYR